MSYGIERTPPHFPNGCFRVEAAARRFNVRVARLKQYARQGLLVPLKSNGGIHYYTEDDRQWVATIGRLLHGAHLSFDQIHQLLADFPCWHVRGCEFSGKAQCPVTSDLSKPCWVNRAATPLSCHLCYSCSVYRSAPDREPIKARLKTPSSRTSATNN